MFLAHQEDFYENGGKLKSLLKSSSVPCYRITVHVEVKAVEWVYIPWHELNCVSLPSPYSLIRIPLVVRQAKEKRNNDFSHLKH